MIFSQGFPCEPVFERLCYAPVPAAFFPDQDTLIYGLLHLVGVLGTRQFRVSNGCQAFSLSLVSLPLLGLTCGVS